MASAPFRERPEFLLGRSGEQRVSTWLKQRGWYVIPSYDYAGEGGDKAPRLQGIEEAFPVPDLDVCRGPRARFGAERRWVEVKTKEAASFTRKTGRYEHGIEHYDDYMRVATLTGTEAWLAVHETTSIHTHELYGVAGALLIQSFANLGPPRRSRIYGWNTAKPMAYWPRESFWLAAVLPLEDDDAAA